MEEFRPERRFLETYFGTFVLVVLTIYAPHLWLLLTDAGNDFSGGTHCPAFLPFS